MPQTENIGDLLLQQLNDPQKMQQLGQMLSSLGLGGPANAQTNAQQTSSEPNLSALLSSLQQQMENGSSGQNHPCSWPCSRARRRMVQTLQVRPYPPYRAPHPGPTRPPSAWTPS